MDVLPEQVVSYFTLFIFAKMGCVKALPWSPAWCPSTLSLFWSDSPAALHQRPWQPQCLMHTGQPCVRSGRERCLCKLRRPSSGSLLLHVPHCYGTAIFFQSIGLSSLRLLVLDFDFMVSACPGPCHSTCF